MTEESKKFGAIGGKKRAANLSKKERSEAAKRAALARWSATAETTDYTGVLEIGDARIACAVLNDEGRTRVLTQGDFLEALGRHRKASVRNVEGEEQVPPILQGEALKPFISKELLEKSKPVIFRTQQGAVASGYRADILPDVCAVYLKAYTDGALRPTQYGIAAQAGILLHGLATVGIIAMVDEATGYQAVRDQNALAKFLHAYIAKELRRWVSTFPREFFEQLYRLKGLGSLPADMRISGTFGKIINDLVYDRLGPGIRAELNRRNPVVTETGRRRHKHFQYLTEHIGHPKLLHHLGKLIGLAHGFEDGEYDAFYARVNKVLPVQNTLPLFAQAEAAADAATKPLSAPKTLKGAKAS